VPASRTRGADTGPIPGVNRRSRAVFELFAVGAALFVLALVFGLLWSVASLVMWLVFLPFHLLRFVFKGFALLFALPLIALVLGIVGVAIGLPLLLLLAVPLLPLVLLCAAVVWVARRAGRPSPAR
jgi:hypothetical protein